MSKVTERRELLHGIDYRLLQKIPSCGFVWFAYRLLQKIPSLVCHQVLDCWKESLSLSWPLWKMRFRSMLLLLLWILTQAWQINGLGYGDDSRCTVRWLSKQTAGSAFWTGKGVMWGYGIYAMKLQCWVEIVELKASPFFPSMAVQRE